MSTLNSAWRRLRDQIGGVAQLAAGILAAGLLFLAIGIRPLEARLDRLNGQFSRDARQNAANPTRAGTPSAKLAAFYAYFDRQAEQVDWLARLYGSARGAGLDFRAADYRLTDTESRIARYEVVLPLSGTYAQLRTFLANVLEENPVLSLDQFTLRRKRVNDSVIEAEAVFTIHLLRP